MTRDLIRKIVSAAIIPLAIWGVYSSIHDWSHEDAFFILFISLFAIIIGIGNLLPEDLLESDYDKEECADSTESAPVEYISKSHPDYTATILILRNYTAEGLDKFERLLADDDRVLAVNQDEGRYYSVPDGDDLPEWYSLHVNCKVKHVDKLLADLVLLTRDNFSKELASEFEVRRID